MIQNERQYAITTARAEKFAQALDELARRPAGELHPVLRRAEEDALRSQLADLREELDLYDAPQSDFGTGL
ncbi:MAG: hypothetical protein L0Z62_35845 [Gemmataceae bacterium]|nr:hypothetical protein [Gemmataceae bacterium]